MSLGDLAYAAKRYSAMSRGALHILARLRDDLGDGVSADTILAADKHTIDCFRPSRRDRAIPRPTNTQHIRAISDVCDSPNLAVQR